MQKFYEDVQSITYEYGKLEMKSAAMRQALAVINSIGEIQSDGSMVIKPTAQQAAVIQAGLKEIGL